MTHDRTKSHGRLFLLAGGGSRGGALLATMLASLGIPTPRVAYVGAASDDDKDFFARLRNLLLESGAGAVQMMPLTGRRRVGARAIEAVERADIVFVSGGDVELGMRTLQKCGAVQLLADHFHAGKAFIGISAGTIMLAQAWVRWRDPDDDASAERFPCLGFAPILCDTHDEASGWQELRALLAISPTGSIGYGIPSGGGITIEPDGTLTPCGRRLVLFRTDGVTVSELDPGCN